MKIIILAGGLGTRLRSEVSEVPKVMAPVLSKPFLEYLLLFFSKQFVDEIILSVGYKKEMIYSFFHKKYEEMHISYIEESKPLGTGGAIKKAISNIDDSIRDVIITNGDTFLEINLDAFMSFHTENANDITLALVSMKDFDRYGAVTLDGNNNIISFEEKKYCENGLINAGTYIIKKEIFQNYTSEENFSFEIFLEENLKKLIIGAMVLEDAYFIDIGIPQDYKKAQIDFKEIF